MKRYKLEEKVKFGIACEIGEWVKYSEASEEIKKLREALEETILYMEDGELAVRERGTCYMSILKQAKEALRDGE